MSGVSATFSMGSDKLFSDTLYPLKGSLLRVIGFRARDVVEQGIQHRFRGKFSGVGAADGGSDIDHD
jgi:hypothetical protein